MDRKVPYYQIDSMVARKILERVKEVFRAFINGAFDEECNPKLQKGQHKITNMSIIIKIYRD